MIRTIIYSLLFVFFIILAIVVYNDIKYFDQTEGGYEPPYEGVTGKPYDWDKFVVTETGLRNVEGKILQFSFNCTNGQINGYIGPLKINIKMISERAIKVHKIQDQCLKNGFKPEWKY
jgi:hypothetical protein